MRQSIYRGNRESDARQDKRTQQRHTACSYANLRNFGARKRNGASSFMEPSQVYRSDPHRYTRRVKEAIQIRLHILITSIEAAEWKFLKHGYLRSESITAVQLQSGPLREHHLLVGIIMMIEMDQSQRTNVHK